MTNLMKAIEATHAAAEISKHGRTGDDWRSSILGVIEEEATSEHAQDQFGRPRDPKRWMLELALEILETVESWDENN